MRARTRTYVRTYVGSIRDARACAAPHINKRARSSKTIAIAVAFGDKTLIMQSLLIITLLTSLILFTTGETAPVHVYNINNLIAI